MAATAHSYRIILQQLFIMRGLFSSICLLLAAVPSIFAANSAGCGKAKTLNNQQYSVQVNGKSRSYILNIPDNYNQSNPYRLVFLWHQLGGSAQKIVNGENPNAGGVIPYYGLKALAGNSAIFVVPEGLNAGWANSGGEDVAFFDAVVKTVEADLCESILRVAARHALTFSRCEHSSSFLHGLQLWWCHVALSRMYAPEHGPCCCCHLWGRAEWLFWRRTARCLLWSTRDQRLCPQRGNGSLCS